MPSLSTHFLTNAMLIGMNLSLILDRLRDGQTRDIPALFEDVYFANIEVTTNQDLKVRHYALPPQLEKGLLETLGRIKHIDPMIALIIGLNIKHRLETHVDKEQGRANPSRLIAPMLDGMAELSCCDDIPPELRAKSFISVFNDPLYGERESEHLSAVRSALRLCADPLQKITQAELAAACINATRGYIGKYEAECEADLNLLYVDLADEAIAKWCYTVEALPTHVALTHLNKVEFVGRWDDFEQLAAKVTSIHYQSECTHMNPEDFRDALARMPAP